MQSTVLISTFIFQNKMVTPTDTDFMLMEPDLLVKFIIIGINYGKLNMKNVFMALRSSYICSQKISKSYRGMKSKIFVGFCCLIIPAIVQAEEHWIADQKNSCKIKNPLPIPDEAVSWSGSCKDGNASGQGKLLWLAKNKLFLTIEGVFEDGQCHRNCTVSTETGNKYLGEMLDNRPDGNGVMTYADGTKYSGGWSGGKKHGKGVFTANDGSSQEETWEHGKQISDTPH